MWMIIARKGCALLSSINSQAEIGEEIVCILYSTLLLLRLLFLKKTEKTPAKPAEACDLPREGGRECLMNLIADCLSRPVQRTRSSVLPPQCDPVGTEGPARRTTKCLFSGRVIEIGVKQMTDAGMRSVECPECLSMRSFTHLEEAMHFPPHDSRKTRTPNRGARWVRREGAWEPALR